MTDLEAAELIASHKGWVEWAKKHWAWKVRDNCTFENRLHYVIGIDQDKVELAEIYQSYLHIETMRGLDQKGWHKKSDCIPISREDQLMDMLEAKEVNEISFNPDSKRYLVGINKYMKESIKFEFEHFLKAPTRLLALFEAVCKVYGLNGKAE